MIPIVGYTDRTSAAPGGEIAFKVSSTSAQPYRASLVRVVNADPNPAGPGMKYVDLSDRFAIERASRVQHTALGSYARVDAAAQLRLQGPLTVVALVWPTLPDAGWQCVLSRGDPGKGPGFALSVGPHGVLAEAGAARVATGRALEPRRWYRVWMTIDTAGGRLEAGVCSLSGGHAARSVAVMQGAHDAAAPLLIGACDEGAVARHFNGRIEDPMLIAAVVDGATMVLDPSLPAAGLVAAWDFSQRMDTLEVRDVGPNRIHGLLVNLPTRAVRGARWSGREMCWRHAPRDYAAIHFHDDDIHDAGWDTDFVFRVPDDLPSGVYAMRLRAGAATDEIPFWVLPSADAPRAAVVFVAPTFTYQAYANHARGNFDASLKRRVADWGAYPHNPDEHPQFGRSTYNVHRDGSGICMSSRLRPVINTRPGYVVFDDARGSGVRHFVGDLHLLDWLEVQGIRYDVVTDHDLDDRGVELLAPYRVVLTGTHPEYHTAATLDAFRAHLDGGGRLAYLGGNGFYWRIATSAKVPGVIEIRRAEGGIRAWASEAGEYYHALDGAYGGTWRRNGRPPQQLVGVGFSSQGLYEGSYYRRRPEAADPRCAWLLAGIDDEVIGDFGLCGGGAAGFELDRVDPSQGTPPDALVVATSEGHSGNFIPVFEDMLSQHATVSGEAPQSLVRADMTWFRLPGGGEVFSAGSITFCGSLSHAGYDNNVSRLLRNVIERFLADPNPT